MIVFFLYFLSFIIIAFGQPAIVKELCPLAAAGGYGLCFWACSFIRSVRKRFCYSCLWFFLVQLVHQSWMMSLKYQGWYILFVAVGISILLSLQFGILILYLFSSSKFTALKACSVAALACLLEWSHLFFFSGFGFSFAGITLAAYVPSMQLASVLGVLGLSFFVWCANVLLYGYVKNYRSFSRLALFVFVSLVPYLFGAAILVIEKFSSAQCQTLNVLLVQTGLSPSQKTFMKNYPDDFVPLKEQWQDIIHSVALKSSCVGLVVLPENAVPYGFRRCLFPINEIELLFKEYFSNPQVCFPQLKDPFAAYHNGGWFVSNAFILQTLANLINSEIVAGLDDFDPLTLEHYNAAFCFEPFIESVERYEKQVLLPLAEALPWRFLKRFTKNYGITEFFSPGRSPKLLSKKHLLGVNVCVEETIPEVIRGFKKNGAKLLVNITNDGWYPRTFLPMQHFFYARLRAVENGLPLLRSCNTGLTTAIDSNGRYDIALRSESRSSPSEKGAFMKKIIYRDKFTLYSLWGDNGIIVPCLFLLFYSVIYRGRRTLF